MIIPHLIVGGGLAGIAIANTLAKAGAPFLLLEAAPRLGGRVDSELTAQACFEFGPNSFSDKSPAIFALLGDLGLMETLLSPTPAAKNRYILKHGRLVRLPAAPPELLTTGALSFRGKLRFLREFFLPPGKPDGRESVDAFFTRHFGAEVARYFADPFVSGIFAGDPRRLSLADAFPKMAAAEAQSARRYPPARAGNFPHPLHWCLDRHHATKHLSLRASLPNDSRLRRRPALGAPLGATRPGTRTNRVPTRCRRPPAGA